MATLKDKIKKGLDEARILVLGAEVLIGFQYQSVFQKGFEKLPEHAQYLKVGGLALLLISLTLLMLPAPFHHIVERGEETDRFHRFITRAMAPALLPFAVGLGIDLFVAGENIQGVGFGMAFGVIGTLMALWFWYGLEAMNRARHQHGEEGKEMGGKQNNKESGGGKLTDKVNEALTEARVVLPGAQALLGFQFAAILTEGFDKLSQLSKYVHVASLGAIALCTVLLMAPAAYHRIVERGEDTEHFLHLCSRFVLWSMVPLALGLAGDFYLVVLKVTKSAEMGLTGAVAMLLFTLGAWFGYTALKRGQHTAEVTHLRADAA